MLAKVITGNSGWDIVFPTHSRIEPMRANGLLAAARPRVRSPASTNLDARFRAPAWDAGLAMVHPLHVERHRHRLQPQAVPPPPRAGPTCGVPTCKGRLTMLDDPEDMLGACLKKLGTLVQRHRRPPVAARRTRSHRAEAAPARLPQCRSPRSAGRRRRAGRAALVHHRAAGHRRRPAPRLRLSRRGLPLLLRLRRHPARKPPSRNWRTSSWTTCCAPPSRPRSCEATRTATANGVGASPSARLGRATTPALYPPRDIFARGEWPRTLDSATQRLRDRIWTEIKSA